MKVKPIFLFTDNICILFVMYRREQQLALYNKRRKSIVRPIIKAQERLDRLSKKRPHKTSSDLNRLVILW